MVGVAFQHLAIALCSGRQGVAADGLPAWFVDSRPVGESPRGVTLENELKAGKFGVIRSLLRVLEGGGASKVRQSTGSKSGIEKRWHHVDSQRSECLRSFGHSSLPSKSRFLSITPPPLFTSPCTQCSAQGHILQPYIRIKTKHTSHSTS